MTASTRRHHRAFTMVEVVLATATVGVLAVGALSVSVSAAKERTVAASRARAANLAQSMLDEVLSVPAEARSGGSLLDAVAEELAKATAESGGLGGADATARATFDQLTDYNGWTSTPPTDRNGVAVPGAEGYTRTVAVTQVAGGDPAGPEVADTGVYRIEVSVLRNGVEVITATAIRTASFDEATP